MIKFLKIGIIIIVLLLGIVYFSAPVVFGAEIGHKDVEALQKQVELLQYEKKYSDLEKRIETFFGKEQVELEKLKNNVDNGWENLNIRADMYDKLIAWGSILLAVFGLLGFIFGFRRVEKQLQESKEIVDKTIKRAEKDVDRVVKSAVEKIERFLSSAERSVQNINEMERILEKETGKRTKDEKELLKDERKKSRNKSQKDIMDWYLLGDYEKNEKNYKGAEKYFKVAISLIKAENKENEHSWIISNYASFLSDQGDRAKKDSKEQKDFYERAEKHYKKALEIEPESAINNGNYAGFLFARGRNNEAEKYWEKSFGSCKGENEKPLLLELYFYHYAHAQDKDVQQEAKKQVQILLGEGIESPYFNLAGNVQKAWDDNHIEKKEVKNLAERISRLEYSPE